MERTPPTLDMLPDGRFRSVRPGLPLSTKLMIGGAVLAVLAAAAIVATLALWLISLLIPVAIVAAAVAYVTFRVQQWRSRGRVGLPRAR